MKMMLNVHGEQIFSVILTCLSSALGGGHIKELKASDWPCNNAQRCTLQSSTLVQIEEVQNMYEFDVHTFTPRNAACWSVSTESS
jgi:hypothetical protein